MDNLNTIIYIKKKYNTSIFIIILNIVVNIKNFYNSDLFELENK
jgi:hypothetical protein